MKRKYLLNEKEISASSVAGIIHTARNDKPFACLDCETQVLKGQKWVEWNYPFHSEFYWHLDCYLKSHTDEILGVRAERRSSNSIGMLRKIKSSDPRYRYAHSFVICERVSDIPSKEDT